MAPVAVERGDVKDPITAGDARLQALTIYQVTLDQVDRQAIELAGVGSRAGQRPHPVTFRQQVSHQCAADEPGASGYECPHSPSCASESIGFIATARAWQAGRFGPRRAREPARPPP